MSLRRRIQSKVEQALAPVHLEVVDESGMHNVPPGSESHFRLLIVSSRFAGMSRVRRHRRVYGILAEEMQERIHALGLQTLTPEEWRDGATHRVESPECLGGDGTGPTADE